MSVAEQAAEGVLFLADTGARGGGAEQAVDACAEEAGRAEAERRGRGGDEAEGGAVGEEQRRQRPLQRRAHQQGQELADHHAATAPHRKLSRGKSRGRTMGALWINPETEEDADELESGGRGNGARRQWRVRWTASSRSVAKRSCQLCKMEPH